MNTLLQDVPPFAKNPKSNSGTNSTKRSIITICEAERKRINIVIMSLSLHVKAMLANTLTNGDGSHERSASHHERVEGWTEVFGNISHTSSSRRKSKEEEEEKQTLDFGYDWKLDDLYVFRYVLCHSVQFVFILCFYLYLYSISSNYE